MSAATSPMMSQGVADTPLQRIRTARAQHRAGGGSVLDILARQAGGRVTADVAAWCAAAGVRAVLDGDASHVPDFSRWDQARARKERAVLIRRDGAASLAAEDPWDEALLSAVAEAVGVAVEPVAVTSKALQGWLGIPESQHAEEGGIQASRVEADGPIVHFVGQAIRSGYRSGASDIHFECDRTGVTVKHRLDGVMTRYARMAGIASAQQVISRIKVLAQLDITERRLPQDGRFRWTDDGEAVDLRVSVMPSVHGEDAVLRLLDKSQLRGQDTTVSLDGLGFPDRDAEQIRELAQAPSGMLLITGPTGSGKTTTVYAALSEINTGLEKIITIEDPVEYELPGVLQIPVNDRKGLTFARGLRSILRHDPDRILVGEIRDAETAEIAVQSALTGHLVFTTVHANSMTDVIGRFRHFGLDMFGFMSSLNGLVVQRLLRRLCPACRGSGAIGELERKAFDAAGRPAPARVAVPVGCESCHGTGYRGRFVVAEVHRADDTLRDLVTGQAPLSALKGWSSERGILPLSQRALVDVEAGETSVEEVRRVVGWM